MNMKRIVASILAFSLSIFSVFALSACGPDPEELLRDAITQEFDAYKNMDDSIIAQIASQAEEAGLTELGVDNEEFANIVLDGFDYNIDNITVNGDSAVATISITSKSSMDYENQLNAAREAIQNNPDIASMSEEERTAFVGDTVLDVFRNLDIQKETIEIQYRYADNTWTPTNAAEAIGNMHSILFSI